eukprot:COSAG01_NODE_3683_length_5800_cov_3.276267_2_plen_358_part_00
MASLRKVGSSYYVRYRENGKERVEKLGRNISKAVAQKLLRQVEEKLALKKQGIFEPDKIEILGFITQYMQWVKQNQAFKTFQVKETAKKHLLTFLALKPQTRLIGMNDLFTAVIERYKCWRLEAGVSARTINIELNFISNLIQSAKEWGYQVNNIDIKRLSEQKKQPRYFSKEEIQLLLNNASKYMHQIITILLFTGLRINECLNLRWQDIHFENNNLHVANHDTFQTKSKQDRIIPMTSHLKNYLTHLKSHYIDPNTDQVTPRTPSQMTYVICSKQGQRIACVRKAYKRLLKRLKIQNASLHTLRHTFASMCIMQHVDVYALKEFLFFNDTATTEIYTHINHSYKLKNIQKLNAIL